jgi:uncharacterized DUF497 family protein
MIVTWDPDKNTKNINKRKLPFSLGALVFNDAERIERYDEEHSYDEERWQTIGRANGALFVVYMERNDTPHIISVRLADKEERRLYYGYSNLYSGWYRINP